ncbi:hypothetical protein GIB67_037015 [Kingdonia uniflora]|uniref:Uncharacterized protein n=1 Tax=Kingdonia uniflora TaxID=39325 RepID=A0A7J7LHI8_9MAGN|nr:hypothetical protein GIB67_037015 [Kingdonia uniflora]
MKFCTMKDEFNHVAKKQRLSSSKSQEVIDQITREINEALVKIQSPTVDKKAILPYLNNELNMMSPLNRIEGLQKDLDVGLSKLAEHLQISFTPDISKAYRNVDFDSQVINLIIADHFYRQGLFDLGDCFISESSKTELTTTLRAPFFEMYQVLEAMKCRNLEPALNWGAIKGSKLELKLRRLQFLEILQNGNRAEALKYAKTYLAPLATIHLADIQKLMGCLLWANRLESSPYAEYLSSAHWEELAVELTQLFCTVVGQSYQSPLTVTVTAGIQALPTLLKLANVIGSKKREWRAMKQLPVPMDLGKEFQFHSKFVCPVSRDQASEENPPMLMPCGHVLCKQSIFKLANSSTHTFKCPYCPFVVTCALCRQIHF